MRLAPPGIPSKCPPSDNRELRRQSAVGEQPPGCLAVDDGQCSLIGLLCSKDGSLAWIGPTSRSSAARRNIVVPGAAFSLQIGGVTVAEPEKL